MSNRDEARPVGLLYRYYNHKYSLMALKQQRIKITQVKELNDPFELSGIYASNPELQNQLVQKKKEFSKLFGFICFSESWMNLIMWAHYADAYKGFCLGFDVSRLANNELSKVHYKRQQQLVNSPSSSSGKNQQNENSDKHTRDFILTKSSDWKYEKEWRCFMKLNNEDDGNTYEKFPDKLVLKEVLIGLNSSQSVSQIRKLTDKISDDIDVFSTCKMSGQFALERYWLPE